MYATPDKVHRPASDIREQQKEPPEVRIALFVCRCFRNERIIFLTIHAERVARILDITMRDLECAIVTAMLRGELQVVACYKQRDVAESKLAQLKGEIPFIARSCHSFHILSDD